MCYNAYLKSSQKATVKIRLLSSTLEGKLPGEWEGTSPCAIPSLLESLGQLCPCVPTQTAVLYPFRAEKSFHSKES